MRGPRWRWPPLHNPNRRTNGHGDNTHDACQGRDALASAIGTLSLVAYFAGSVSVCIVEDIIMIFTWTTRVVSVETSATLSLAGAPAGEMLG